MTGPGRPRKAHASVAVTLRLDPRALAAWQKKGSGWRQQMAQRLESAVWLKRDDYKPRGAPRAKIGHAPERCTDDPPHCVLIHGDCTTASLPAFDALITDPPYGVGYQSRHRDRDRTTPWGRHVHGENFAPITGDDQPFDPARWLELAGKRPVVLWGANYYTDKLPGSGGWLLWDKLEGGGPAVQADAEMAWTNAINKPRLYSHLWRGLCRRGEENLSRGGRKLHPNQKPVAVMDWILDQCGIQPGQTVLDPYMGSASLGVACLRRGIRYVGCEIDDHYFQVACERLEHEAGGYLQVLRASPPVGTPDVLDG